MPRYCAQFRNIMGRTLLLRPFEADDDDAAMRKANGFRLTAVKRLNEDDFSDLPGSVQFVNPGLYLKAELWDSTGRDIARLGPGGKWERRRGGYVSAAAGNYITQCNTRHTAYASLY